MKNFLLGLTLIISPSVYAEVFPAGLRLPTQAELSKEPLRNESPTKNATVIADFNGDEKLDYAYLLGSIHTSRGALAVKLSTNNNDYEWKIIDNDLNWNGEPMGIDPAKPDYYETACGKGYWECGKNDPASITLKNAGFSYSPYEKGGAVLIYWDSISSTFKQVILND